MPDEEFSDQPFDAALIGACFAAIARDGWHRLSIPAAAQQAGLDLARARVRVPNRATLLYRFGALADRAALADQDGASTAPVQERLFDLLMRRIDVLQAHRAGMIALLRALPTDPLAAMMLAAASLESMRWLLQAAGVPAQGVLGLLRAKGLLGVWVWTLRTWQTDDSPDLAATMSTLDTALARAAQIARSLPGSGETSPAETASTEAAAPAAAASAAEAPAPILTELPPGTVEPSFD
jgi:ubiquinone biosynthesis protein COQ9